MRANLLAPAALLLATAALAAGNDFGSCFTRFLRGSAQEEGTGPNEDFAPLVGRNFLEAEQKLPDTTPIFSNAAKVGGMFVKSFRYTGELDARYIPSSAKTFPLFTVDIPVEDLGMVQISENISAKSEKELFLEKDGKKFARFFIHPNEFDHYKTLLEKYPLDSDSVVATPSSSTRSLFVVNPDEMKNPFGLKVSISVRMGRYARIVDIERVTRAVKLNDAIEQIYKESGGKLKSSGKSWNFLREDAAILPPDPSLGGYIHRELPPDLKDKIILPVYSLIAKRPNGQPRWVDELFEHSGKPRMNDFVWEDLVKPMTELHCLLSINNGLTTELHQQNTLFVINPRTLKVEGVLLRDMDAHLVDHSLRIHRLEKKPITASSDFDENVYLFRYGLAQANQFRSYTEKLRMESVEWMYKYALNRKQMKGLLGKMDQFVADSFNEQFPEAPIQNAGELRKGWQKVHELYTTPEEKAVYDAVDNKYKPGLTSKIIDSLQKWHVDRSLKAPLKQ